MGGTVRTEISNSPSIVKLLEFGHLKLIKENGNNKEIENVERVDLPYPSLNEVNYLAFDEANEEYHNELYGFIESENELTNFKAGKATVAYNKIMRNGSVNTFQIIRSELIRHQIHHPENTNNVRFTNDELQQSIGLMRVYIKENIL